MAVEGQRFMTKTQHYRKVTKPLLERKRRARMNLYLDELKDLIVDTMEAQGEHVSKLEKADILEMTVNYLKAQKHGQRVGGATTPAPPAGATAAPQLNFDKFRAGYTQAAYEVSHIFSTLPGLDLKFGTQLMKQLGHQLKDIKQTIASPTASERSISPDLADLEHEGHDEDDDDEDIDVGMADNHRDKHAAKNGEDVWRPW